MIYSSPNFQKQRDTLQLKLVAERWVVVQTSVTELYDLTQGQIRCWKKPYVPWVAAKWSQSNDHAILYDILSSHEDKDIIQICQEDARFSVATVNTSNGVRIRISKF